MQTVKIVSIQDASLELSGKGGYKLTAKINGSKQPVEAWISKALLESCKTQDALVKRLKSCKDINLGASVEINEAGNSIIKYWVTRPSTMKVVASW